MCSNVISQRPPGRAVQAWGFKRRHGKGGSRSKGTEGSQPRSPRRRMVLHKGCQSSGRKNLLKRRARNQLKWQHRTSSLRVRYVSSQRKGYTQPSAPTPPIEDTSNGDEHAMENAIRHPINRRFACGHNCFVARDALEYLPCICVN